MTEQEFRLHADEALDSAERALTPMADEGVFELERQDGVLTLTFDEPPGTKFVVSPNTPMRQVWVSALSRSHKLSWSDASRAFELNGEPLNTMLQRLARSVIDEA
jgi:CyaY protein